MPTCESTLLRGDGDVDIPPGLIQGIGVTGLVVALFWMLAKEVLVTGPAHRRELATKDEQIAEVKTNADLRIADKDAQVVMWKAAFETKDAQGMELLEHSRLSVQLLQAIEKRAEEERAARQTGA